MNFEIPPCVLFDLDGTVLDSLPGIDSSFRHACRSEGVPEPMVDLRPMLGPPIRSIFARTLNANDDELLDRLEAAFRANYDAEGWRKTSCYWGARQVLTALKRRGHRLFVVSNKPQHISVRILEHHSLLPLFEGLYTRDSRKPPYTSKTEMVRQLLTDYDVSGPECLLVGDTMEDIQASTGNGMDAVWMEHGYGEVLPDVPVKYRVRSFEEFLDRAGIGESR